MQELIRLRIHVNEPFDFERENGVTELYGITGDHLDAGNEEWLIETNGPFTFAGEDHDAVLVAPRYGGEHLSRVFDSLAGFPVRIACPDGDDWQFVMTGLLSVPPPEPEV
jgi:hypothetical protein